jgi:L-ascorbate metabolism protein UlaG (beta-lactamase superfamily)
LVQVQHIANTGALLSYEGGSLLVDALYEAIPFAPLTDVPERRQPQLSFPACETLDAMLTGAPPFDRIRAYLFTHLHPDHGNVEVIARIADPSIPVILPATARFEERIRSLPGKKIVLTKPIEKHEIGEVSLTAIRTEHDGGLPFALESYAFLIEFPAYTVFMAGDAKLEDENLCTALLDFVQGGVTRGGQIGAAFLNYPEISRVQGRKFITEILRPGRLFLTHLPPEVPGEKRNTGSLDRSLERYGAALPPITLLDSAGAAIILQKRRLPVGNGI